MPLTPVPSSMQGVWTRHYIRRRDASKELGPQCTFPVTYVQTPHAFVDVRPWHGEPAPDPRNETMAFAGVTTCELSLSSPRVSWHACHNLEPPVADFEACWAAALAGAPRPTEDVGDFTRLPGSGNVWREVDPGGTLEEEWERLDDGGGRLLAARRGSALLCVAGNTFGFADDCGARGPDLTGPRYVAGRVDAGDGVPPWCVDSATVAAMEGHPLVLPGSASEWTSLPGCTLALPTPASAGAASGSEGACPPYALPPLVFCGEAARS